MAAEMSALKRDLADACAALAAQKASNKGLQIRVAELLAAKNRWTSNEKRAPVNPFLMVHFRVSPGV